MEELIKQVIEWARVRGIFEKSSPLKQLSKTLSELNELYDGIVDKDFIEIKDGIGDTTVTLILQSEMQGLPLGHIIFAESTPQQTEENSIKLMSYLFHEIGSLLDEVESVNIEGVQLAIDSSIRLLTEIAKDNDLTLTECLEYAYDEIKDRKGQMVDGLFVKES